MLKNFSRKTVVLNVGAVLIAVFLVGGVVFQNKKEADALSLSLYEPVGGPISVKKICCNGLVLKQGKISGSGNITGDMILEWVNIATALKAEYKVYKNVTDLGLVRTVGAYCTTITSSCQTQDSLDGTYEIIGTNDETTTDGGGSI